MEAIIHVKFAFRSKNGYAINHDYNELIYKTVSFSVKERTLRSNNNLFVIS
jgi:hypothetical protein